MTKKLLIASALALIGSVQVAHAATNTYGITTTWYEPDTAPRNSIFIGTFDYDTTTKTITGLKGILSESMTGDPTRPYDPTVGPGNYAAGGDSMTWLGLDNTSNADWGAMKNYGGKTYTYDQIRTLHEKYNIAGPAPTGGLNNQLLPSWHDDALGGTFAITFRNTNTNTFLKSLTDPDTGEVFYSCDGWSPSCGVEAGGVYAGFPIKKNNPGNASALIFVPDSVINAATTSLSWNEATGTGDLGVAYTSYTDFVPTVHPGGQYDFGGGMMGAVGMTATSIHVYGAVGTMGGVPLSEEITLISSTAPVPEPETYAMFLAGLGILGAVARRKKSA